MDLDPDLVFTQLANRLRQVDLPLVDLDAELLELPLDVAAVTEPYSFSSSPTFTSKVSWTSASRVASVSAADFLGRRVVSSGVRPRR